MEQQQQQQQQQPRLFENAIKALKAMRKTDLDELTELVYGINRDRDWYMTKTNSENNKIALSNFWELVKKMFRYIDRLKTDDQELNLLNRILITKNDTSRFKALEEFRAKLEAQQFPDDITYFIPEEKKEKGRRRK